MLRRSLIVRLVGMSLLLLLLLIVQAAGFAVVRATIDRNARSQIARELDTDENVWRRLLDQNAEKLRQGSALLAADYGFRSAVNSDDEETIQSVLENHGSRIGAEVTALLDTRLNLRSLSASGGARDFQAAVRQVAPLLASQPQGSRMAVIGGVPYQFVMVPMRAPVVIGWVLMGFPVSQPLADEMRQLLSVHVALLVKGEDGVLSVPVSTLPAAPLALLRRQGIHTGELDTDQGVLLARASPLDTVGGRSAGAVAALGGRGRCALSPVAGVAGHHHGGRCAAVCLGQWRDGKACDDPFALAAGRHTAIVPRRVRRADGAHRPRR